MTLYRALVEQMGTSGWQNIFLLTVNAIHRFKFYYILIILSVI